METALLNVKVKHPLVHCITNYVTVNDCANALLACGASPVMADDVREVEEIVEVADALVINTGTLNSRTIEAMLVAGKVTDEGLERSLEFIKAFALKTGAIVAVTGEIDIVTNVKSSFCIRNGHPMMASVTGTGCQLSALVAAFIAANPAEPLKAAAAAVCEMGLAGETAYKRLTAADGNATYRNYIIDAIFTMTAEALKQGAKYEAR